MAMCEPRSRSRDDDADGAVIREAGAGLRRPPSMLHQPQLSVAERTDRNAHSRRKCSRCGSATARPSTAKASSPSPRRCCSPASPMSAAIRARRSRICSTSWSMPRTARRARRPCRDLHQRGLRRRHARRLDQLSAARRGDLEVDRRHQCRGRRAVQPRLARRDRRRADHRRRGLRRRRAASSRSAPTPMR